MAEPDVVKTLRKVEKSIEKEAPMPIPISEADFTGPVSYKDDKEAPLVGLARTAAFFDTKAQIQVPVTSEDVKRMKEKAWVAVLRDFDIWVAETFLKGQDEPSRVDWLRRHYPQWFDKQIAAMNQLNDAKARYQKLLIGNCTSKADLWFMYVYERDFEMLKNSTNEVANVMLGLEEREKDDATIRNQENFQRGVWNTRRQFDLWASVAMLPAQTMPGVEEVGGRAALLKNQTNAANPATPGIKEAMARQARKLGRAAGPMGMNALT
jgi:hypothetical protein